jgi:hypothetical protein
MKGAIVRCAATVAAASWGGALLCAPASWAQPVQGVSAQEARQIARDAYVYGVPMVSMYGTMFAFSVDKTNKEYKGPFNSILNIARVFTPDDTAFVTPNSDTPYTFLGLDLRAEPVVITLPAIEKGRYFVFQMLDLYTFNFDYLGTRTTGNGGGNYLVAGPTWKGRAPAAIKKVIRSETEFVNVVGRTQLFNPADLDNVKTIQSQYKVRPLSAFLGKEGPALAPAVDWVKPIAPADQRKSLEFFNVLSFVLQFAQPPHPSEGALRKRFARIGIGPGKPFDVASLSPEMKSAFEAGMADGQKAIDDRRAALGGKSAELFGARAFLKNDYVRRAVGTQVGIGVNSAEEALYPIYERDAEGAPLNGDTGRYAIRFAGGKFPPVNAFWSLTMYGLPSQLLVKNPIGRYLINAPMLPNLKRDADDGLTVYVQNESPGADKESNWLPAPKGPFMVAARYYWPKPELLQGKWKSPPMERAR